MVVLDLFVNSLFVIICSTDYNYIHDLLTGEQEVTRQDIYVCRHTDGVVYPLNFSCDVIIGSPDFYANIDDDTEIFHCNNTRQKE